MSDVDQIKNAWKYADKVEDRAIELADERDKQRARAAALAAEVERLTAETAAYRSDWRAWEALARLNIEYTGNDPLERLVEENTALRAQLAGEGWRPVSEPPTGLTAIEVVIDGGYNDLHPYGENHYFTDAFGDAVDAKYWRPRPTPPQE